jgi:signal transduction histidine kinase/ligand-binding sensor domain-containing protein
MLAVACLLASVFVTPALALDPQKSIMQFVHTSWTEKDGAPSKILALAQTTDGYLWLGTSTGLFHFDGVRFVHFEPLAGESLPETRVQSLLAGRDGSLWIVWPSGAVSRLLNNHLTSYSEPQGLPRTFRLAERSDGSLIAGTDKGLARFENGIWKDAGKEWNFPARQATLVYFDRADTLWVLTEDRALYLPAGESRFIDPGEAAGGSFNFAQAPDGSIWISEVGRSAHEVRRSGEPGPMTEVQVGASSVLFDRNQALWVGSVGDGLRRIPNPAWIRGRSVAQFGTEAEQFTTKDGLSANIVRCALEDREGNIWFGTDRGLDRFRETAFTAISIPNPDSPKLIVATRDGSLWTSAWNKFGLVRIRPGGEKELTTPELFIRAMFEDEAGVLWVVGNHNTMFRIQDGRIERVILPGDTTRVWNSITSDRSGGLWLFEENEGLFRFADGALTNVASQSDPTNLIGRLYTDRRGRIWLGQYGLVSLYDHGKLQVFGSREGISPAFVCAFLDDQEGNVWVGSEDGLRKFENGRFRKLSESNGFPARVVSGLARDDDGNWWIAGDNGVLRIPAKELDHAITDPAYRLRYESFDMLDGLPGKITDSRLMTVVARTTDGRIWLAATDGLAYVDPRRIPKNTLPPPVHVETVKLDGKEVEPDDGMALATGTNYIEIGYTALSLSIPERVRFRYMLDGKDTKWHDAGNQRQAYYNGLAPGEYRFHVIASNNDGVWNEAGATLVFRVLPAWYQTYWFLSLCVVTGLSMVWVVYTLRVRQIAKAISVRFDERLAERTRIARDFHDTLLQSFQGVLLKFHAVTYMLPDRPGEARQKLESVIDQAQQAVVEGRDTVQGLRSSAVVTNDLVPALRALGEELAADQTGRNCPDFRVIVEGASRDLVPLIRDEVYRIASEAVRNAFRHAEAKQIEVEILYARRQLRLWVSDNGKGIDPKVLAEGGREGHYGLAGMHERAKLVGGKLAIWSKPDSGTDAELTIPSSLAYAKSPGGRQSLFSRKKRDSDSIE